MAKPTASQDNHEIWEQRYARGAAVLRYPFDAVVSFVFQKLRRAPDAAVPRVLDFGCGAGNHVRFLAENGYEPYGVDISPSALAQAGKAVRSVAPDFPGDRLKLMEGNQIPFADAMFDAAIDRSSLGQNRHGDIVALVDEIYRVLQPGGVYFGINFSDRHPDLAHGNSLGNGDYADFHQGVFKGLGTRHFFSVEEIETLFARFDILDIRLLSDMSVRDKGGNVQVIVEARKPE